MVEWTYVREWQTRKNAKAETLSIGEHQEHFSNECAFFLRKNAAFVGTLMHSKGYRIDAVFLRLS